MKIYGNIKIIDSPKEIRRKFLAATLNEMNQRLKRAIPNIINKSKEILLERLVFAPECILIANGKLDADLGFQPGEGKIAIDSVIRQIIQSVDFSFNPLTISGDNISGGLEIFMIRSSFDDILNLLDAYIITGTGDILPWLEWLLFEGDRVIIAGFDMKIGNFSNSRSGYAIMVESKGGSWKVPSNVSGTKTDNFLTRSINDNLQGFRNDVTSLCEKELLKVF